MSYAQQHAIAANPPAPTALVSLSIILSLVHHHCFGCRVRVLSASRSTINHPVTLPRRTTRPRESECARALKTVRHSPCRLPRPRLRHLWSSYNICLEPRPTIDEHCYAPSDDPLEHFAIACRLHTNEKQSWTHLLASGGALSPAPSRMVLEIRRQ